MDVDLIFCLTAMYGSAFIIVFTVYRAELKRDQRKQARRTEYYKDYHEHAFRCPACAGCGETRLQPEFNCRFCDGTGLLIYRNHNSRLKEMCEISDKAARRHEWTRKINVV